MSLGDAANRHAACLPLVRAAYPTAMQKLRIVRLGFGTW
jgi:hypothetical protein